MNRGDVVIGAMRGEFTGKPRPYVIVQRQTTISDSMTVTVCPLTTGLVGHGPVRVAVVPDSGNGLDTASEIDVGRVTTIRRRGISAVVGHLSSATMAQLDVALKRWLDL